MQNVIKILPWVIILIMGVIFIFKKPVLPEYIDKEPAYKDSIDVLDKQRAKRDSVIDIRNNEIDSLLKIKPKNHIEYVTSYKFINKPSTTILQLDSVIRELSGINR